MNAVHVQTFICHKLLAHAALVGFIRRTDGLLVCGILDVKFETYYRSRLRLWLYILTYQLVLLHGLIRVILKINHTTNNYNYLSHALASIKYSNTYKIYIYHNIVAIDFILHHTYRYI